MTSDSPIIVVDTIAKTDRIASDPVDQIEIGEWYWADLKGEQALWCVMHIGSNFAKIRSPHGYTNRIHFDEWEATCRHESSPQTWFDLWSGEEKKAIRRINQEIKDICSRLGVSPDRKRIGDGRSDGGSNLSIVSSAASTDTYKTELVKAEQETLPALFKQIKEHSEELTKWLEASSMSVMATCGNMEETIGVMKDRIFMISIYAGLVEQVEQVRDGEPAEYGEKLRIMQGKLFMDEECLLNYSRGGMEFKDICDFDAWLSKSVNLERILPYPRCMVAFEVRRFEKHRQGDGSLLTAWINFELAQDDKLTFLYVRNGDRLYRLNSELEFGNELFAGRDEFVFEEMMVNNSDRNHPTMPVRDYESRVEEHKQKRKEFAKKRREFRKERERFVKWQNDNPDADEEGSGIHHTFRSPFEPYWSENFDPKDWSILNDSNVYVDDVNDRIRKQANEYNRISTMIQGLLDRSEILHPHPPVKLWTSQGFDQFIELIYDHDRTLFDGAEPPSWAEYKAKCGESIGVGSIVVGQYEEWRASLPRKIDYRSSRRYEYTPSQYTEGNPGPGNVVQKWSKKTRKATFQWKQTRYIYRASRYENSGKRSYDRSISVPADKLFNISAYKLGDYKQFFNDPRTRRSYLQWAHMLLTAEEYHSGNLDDSLEKSDRKTELL